MIRCNSYCLYNSMRIVNVIVNLFGVVMIIYSLWLLKKWLEGVADLPSRDIPQPWFIYICLAVGIVVCLSSISGHMVAHSINKSILAAYIVSTFSIILIQAWVASLFLFRIDWEAQILKYLDDKHRKFQSFLLFHVAMCRTITILVLLAQITVVVIAAILWAVGGEPTIHNHISVPLDLRHSFLADNNSPGLDNQRRLEEIMKAYMGGMFTRSYRQIRRDQT